MSVRRDLDQVVSFDDRCVLRPEADRRLNDRFINPPRVSPFCPGLLLASSRSYGPFVDQRIPDIEKNKFDAVRHLNRFVFEKTTATPKLSTSESTTMIQNPHGLSANGIPDMLTFMP